MIYTRRATVLDVPVLTGMWIEMTEESTGKRPDPYETAMFFYTATIRLFDTRQCYNHLALLACDDEEIVGSIIAMDKDETKAVTYFENLYVIKPYRGKKVSYLLVTKVLEWAQERGAKSCEMMVRPDIAKFYENLGFETDLVRMSRKIDAALVLTARGVALNV